MFRTFRIRSKLAVALAVPLAALVAIAGFEAVTASRAASDVREQTELARASLGPGSVVAALQNERDLSALHLLGLSGAVDLDVKSNEEARAATDAAADALRVEVADQPEEVQVAYELAFRGLGLLDEQLRDDVDGYGGARDLTAYPTAYEIFDRYSRIVDRMFLTTERIATELDDATLRNGVAIISASAEQSEASAQIVRWVLLSQLTGHADDPGAHASVTTWVERSLAAEREMRAHMVGVFAPALEGAIDTGAGSEFLSEANRFVETGEADIDTMLAVVNNTDGETAETRVAASDIAAAILDQQSDEILDEAVDRQRLFIALAAGMIALALLVTWLASRSITRPLRSLRAQAEEMATVRLPRSVQEILETPTGEDVLLPAIDPIRVKTRDEVLEVADALNTVQASALDLAVEQAVLRRNIADSFVNLGRRNQNLLNRQLEFITDLERNESDPDALEGLFRLDHLATRMRRNAESLLVLAGVEPPRQWSAPVRVADVVRAALGEVEDYQRVVVRSLEPAAVTGSAAADVAHVLAELIENALAFSPPEQTVEVRGRIATTGYTLAITDNGLGMSEEDLQRSNRRLRGDESFTVAPSRYLGHYVAGHLAARHGVQVELQDSPAGGITARVDIPATLVGDEPVPAPAPRQAAPEPERNGSGGWAELAPGAAPAAVATLEPPAPMQHTAGGLPRRGTTAEPSSAPVAPVARETTTHGGTNGGSSLAPVPPTEVPPTPSGLARRVPGAQRPDTSLPGSAPAAEPAAEPPRSSPDDVYAFLSSFQDGVARGLADAHHPDDDQEKKQ